MKDDVVDWGYHFGGLGRPTVEGPETHDQRMLPLPTFTHVYLVGLVIYEPMKYNSNGRNIPRRLRSLTEQEYQGWIEYVDGGLTLNERYPFCDVEQVRRDALNDIVVSLAKETV